MVLLTQCSVLLYLSCGVIAEVHHLLASSYKSKLLFALEYDTVTNTLKETNRITAHAAHSQLALSQDRTTLYGAERAGWSSYRIYSPRDLAYQKTLSLVGRCGGGEYDNGFTNFIVARQPPYAVFGAGKAPCAHVLNAGLDGHLERIVQNVSLSPGSRVQGMALDAANDYLYSADGKGNRVWTHKVDHQSGALSQAKYTEFSEVNTRPSKLAVHPNSQFLYLMQTRANRLVVYRIQRDTSGQPLLNFTGLSYSLIPPGVNSTNYRGQELQLNADQTVLYATTRFRVRKRKDEEENEDDDGEDSNEGTGRSLYRDEDIDTPPQLGPSLRNLNHSLFKAYRALKRQFRSPFDKTPKPAALGPGYLTAIRLETQDGRDGNDAGYPISLLTQVATSTSGGRSNVMSLSPSDSELVALADSEKGLVQVWRFDGVNQLPKGNNIIEPSGSEQNPGQSPPQNAGPRPQQTGPAKPPRPSQWQQSQTPWAPRPTAPSDAKPSTPLDVAPPSSLSSSNPSPSSEISVWMPPPLKPTSLSTLLPVASPTMSSNGNGPSKPGQGQWDFSGNGDANSVIAPSVEKGSTAKPGLQPQIPPGQQGSFPSQPNQGQKSTMLSPDPATSKSPSKPAVPIGAIGTGVADLVPEFVLPPSRKRKARIVPPTVAEIGESAEDFVVHHEATGRSNVRRQSPETEYIVRPSIVAEWKAPVDLIGVGDPAASKDEDNDRPRGSDGKMLPRWGRGCCSFALWLD